MEEWKEYKIEDLCGFQNGYAFKSSDFCSNGKYRVVKIKELKAGQVKFFEDTSSVNCFDSSVLRKYSIKKNDVLFALTGDPVNKPNPQSWVGRVSIYNHDEDALLNQRVCKVIPKDGINAFFLYYYFRQSDVFYSLASKATGSASQANISTKTIGDVSIKIPSLLEQNRIVEILKSLDDKIECNRRINENLEQQAQALFKSWFVDFEPFKDHPFVESDLGMIPKGWKTVKLGQICICCLGGTPSRNNIEYWGGNISWINSGEVNKFRIIEPSEFITEDGLKHSATKLLPKKTTVLAITGATLGQVSLLEIDSCANQSVIGVLENDGIPYEFIYPLINYRIKELMSHMTGGAQQHINKNNVEDLDVIIPDMAVMSKYKTMVQSIYSKIGDLCFENKYIAELRDTLLPRLMSGEITLNDIG